MRRLLGTFCHLSKHRSPPSDWLPGRLCRKSVKKSVRKRLGHKMETDQMSRSIVPEGLSWALNTPWTESLRRTAANPDYRAVIECQLAGIPPQLQTVALLPQAVTLGSYCLSSRWTSQAACSGFPMRTRIRCLTRPRSNGITPSRTRWPSISTHDTPRSQPSGFSTWIS